MYNTEDWVSKYLPATRRIFSPQRSRKNTNVDDLDIEDNEELKEDTSSKAEEDTPLNAQSPLDSTPSSLNQKWRSFKHAAPGKWRTFKRRLPYYVPVMQWLPQYQRANLFADIVAGVTVGVMLVPQAMSYASLAGLPPIYGLYASAMPVMCYAALGHSRQLSVGPEALVSILVGTTLASIQQNTPSIPPEDLIVLAALLSFLSGFFTLVLGLLRFGFLSEVLSRPLIRGFIIAVALTIAVEQLDVMLGIDLPDAKGWHKIPAVLDNLSEIEWIAVVFGVCSVAVLLIFRIVKKLIPENHPNIAMRFLLHFPGVLLVLVIGLVLTYTMRLDEYGLPILGPNKSGIPSPSFPRLDIISYVAELVEPALIISIIGIVETMAVAKFFAASYNYQLSANREFVAVGSANLVGSLFQAWPIYGSLTRSSVADKAGAKTQLAGFITAMIIVFTLLFLMPVFYYLPRVIMASILVVAAMGLIEFHEIFFLYRVRAWKDLFLLVATSIITFIYGAEVGLLLSVGTSVFMVIKHTSVPHISVLGKLPNTRKYKDVTVFDEAETQEGVLVLRVDESLHFANMGQLKDMLYRLESVGSMKSHPTDPAAPPLRALIIDARAIPHVDASALLILLEMIEHYKARGIRVCFVRLRDLHKTDFLRAGILQVTGIENFFNSVQDAADDVDLKTPKRKEYSTYKDPQLNNNNNSGSSNSNSNSNEDEYESVDVGARNNAVLHSGNNKQASVAVWDNV